MKAVITITVELPEEVTRAGFSLYDSNGDVLASETSSGFNVTKRTPAALLASLVEQARQIAADCDEAY